MGKNGTSLLRTLRKGIGLTQGELGAKLGVHWITISRWERGVEPIGVENAVKIGYLFNIPPRAFRPDIFRA